MDIQFRLRKDLGTNKKGTIFECFGGLISGVNGISFLNKEYFHIVGGKIIKQKLKLCKQKK